MLNFSTMDDKVALNQFLKWRLIARKVIDTCLLGHERVILVKIMGKWTAVNSETYVATQQQHQRCVKFVWQEQKM
jgi:hypothetical protein